MQSKGKHLMPVFIRDHHFLYNFLDILISSLDCPIHLWTIKGRIMILNFKSFTQFGHHLIVQIGGIISDYLARQPVPTN